MTDSWYSWSEFINGYWITDPPTEDGTYPICDREGNHAGFFMIWTHRGQTYYNGDSVSKWRGWYWSRPLPGLPRPPEWPKEKLEPEVAAELIAQNVWANTCCDILGCTNEPVDCIAGEFYFCEEHRDDAPQAYLDWEEAVDE